MELPVKKGIRYAAIKLASDKPELFSFRVKGSCDCCDTPGFSEWTLDDFGSDTPQEIEKYFNEYKTVQLWINN